MRYIWEQSNWPHSHYDLTQVQDLLYRYALEAGVLSGGISQLPELLQRETMIDFMVSEAIKTSQIEGENIDPEDVRSSLLNQLGISSALLEVKDPRSTGIAQLMISVRETFNDPLTEDLFFAWHKMVLPTAYQEKYFEVGKWRTSKEPMQVVSGPIGKERIHFEAPPSDQVPLEMKKFIEWYNDTHPVTGTSKIPGPVRAAIAHLYFESIHPFADGNGRIGRAISEKALSQDLQQPILLSLSEAIHKNKKEYYQHLTQASGPQKADQIDITLWVVYFVKTIYEAQLAAKNRISFVFKKACFWNKYDSLINDRQRRVIQRMYQEGVDGFEGGLNARKYMKIADCSKATATRDLGDLLDKGCLHPLPGSGRSARYELVL